LHDRSSAPGCCQHRIIAQRITEISGLRPSAQVADGVENLSDAISSGTKSTSFRSEATAEEPMVCGLSAGASRIRTPGPTSRTQVS